MKQQNMVKGSLGMGLLWGAMYCFTPIVGFITVAAVGGFFDMDAGYGALIQFAFCQGPVSPQPLGLRLKLQAHCQVLVKLLSLIP